MVVVALVIEDSKFKVAGGINESELVLVNDIGEFATYRVANSCPDIIIDGIGYKFLRRSTPNDRWYAGVDDAFWLN
jgi:hypothetical protein